MPDHSKAENPEGVQPGDAPPTEDSSAQKESNSQPQPTEETDTGRSAMPHSDDAGEL